MKGLLDEVREYSKEWQLPDLTVTQVLKRSLDYEAKKTAMNRMWRSLFNSRNIQVRWSPEKTSNRLYFTFSRIESQLVLTLNVGELNLLTYRKNESIKKYGTTGCLIQVCGGEDNLEHVSQCFGYQARPNQWDGSNKSTAEYLLELHKEQIKKFNMPLINFRR